MDKKKGQRYTALSIPYLKVYLWNWRTLPITTPQMRKSRSSVMEMELGRVLKVKADLAAQLNDPRQEYRRHNGSSKAII
jgi:hypothetical protein